MRISLAQMTASGDVEKNLAQMEHFIKQASQAKANVVAFPEMAYFLGRGKDIPSVLTQYESHMKLFSAWAKQYKIDLIPGSIREPTGELPCRQFNTAPYICSDGKLLSQYRKIYLFKASLRDRPYDETQYYDAGKEIVTAKRPWGTAGLAICFDLRFPELFRGLKNRGSQVIFLPAAFAVPTGEVHWHTLLKARAIENQCFVAAPALTGTCGDGRETYGHTLLVSPWGEVLGELGRDVELLTCDISVDDILRYKERLNAWASRRDDLFPLP